MKVSSTALRLCMLAAIAFLFAFSSCSKRRESIKPSYQSLTQAVYASGFISPLDEYLVYAQADGVITDIFKRDGDSVKTGETILQIRSTVQDAKARGTKAALNLAELNAAEDSPLITEALSNLFSIKNKYQLDSLNFLRFQKLKIENSTSQIEFDKAELSFKNSRNEFVAARARLERLKLQVQAEREQAAALNAGSMDELGNTNVRADLDGLIYQVMKEKGEVVRRGEVIARIGNKKKVFLKLQVDEADYSLVHSGQQVLFSADVYGKKTHEAVVTKCYPYISRSEQSFRIDAMPLDHALPSVSGAAVEANILVAEKNKAMVIPAAYLLPGDSVLVSRNGEELKQAVKTGMRDLEYVEVLSGIDAETMIYKP